MVEPVCEGCLRKNSEIRDLQQGIAARKAMQAEAEGEIIDLLRVVSTLSQRVLSHVDSE